MGLLGCVAYALLLLGALTLKMDALFDALGEQLSPQLQRAFAVPGLPMLVLLLCSVLASVCFAVLVLLREAARDLRQPKLRFKGTGALVTLPLPPGKTHHLFVSHVYVAVSPTLAAHRRRPDP